MLITVSRADTRHLSGMVNTVRSFSNECGPRWAARLDEVHATKHMRNYIENGVSFVAEKGGSVIGLIACARIDAAITCVADLETAHIYVLPEERKTRAIFQLLDAVESYARENGVKVLFHQTNYPAAIDGEISNSRQVEALFKRRRYRGPIDVTYASPDFTRVGITYLHDPAKS